MAGRRVLSFQLRKNSEPAAVGAFRGMRVEAMSWGARGNAEYAAALGLSTYELQFSRKALQIPAVKMGLTIPASSECPGLSSAASCVRRK